MEAEETLEARAVAVETSEFEATLEVSAATTAAWTAAALHMQATAAAVLAVPSVRQVDRAA